MDRRNQSDLLRDSLPEHAHKIRLFLEHGGLETTEVPDPYYGGDQGFEHVLDLIEAASDGLICELK